MKSRPRPVIVYMVVVASLQAFLGVAGISALVPAIVLAWLQVTLVVLVVGGAVIVQNKVTPVSSPRDNAGNKLVPAREVQASPPNDPPRRMYGGTPPPRTSER